LAAPARLALARFLEFGGLVEFSAIYQVLITNGGDR